MQILIKSKNLLIENIISQIMKNILKLISNNYLVLKQLYNKLKNVFYKTFNKIIDIKFCPNKSK